MKNISLWLGTATLVLLPGLTLAHPGHGAESSFASGLNHPLGGLDHILAMIAVGFWGAHLGGSARWQLPLAFVLAMVAGGALGMAGVSLPAVEPMIIASSVVIGLALAIGGKLDTGVAAILCAGFALFHGAAHGMEMPAASSALSYAVGFVIATAALHLTGFVSGLAAHLVPNLHRWAGAAFALGGLMLSA